MVHTRNDRIKDSIYFCGILEVIISIIHATILSPIGVGVLGIEVAVESMHKSFNLSRRANSPWVLNKSLLRIDKVLNHILDLGSESYIF